jgi:hypothetical protein
MRFFVNPPASWIEAFFGYPEIYEYGTDCLNDGSMHPKYQAGEFPPICTS